MNKPCPYCGEEPLMYKGKKSGELWVHCHNGSYKGLQGVECPSVDRSFTVEEWNTRPIEDKLQAELSRRDEIITRLKEDAERLAGKLISMYADEMYECSYCGHGVSKSPDEIEHTPDCPITLHRTLMKELE